jgi:hypothetical protein
LLWKFFKNMFGFHLKICHLVNIAFLIVKKKKFLTFGMPFTFKLKCQVIADKTSLFSSVLVTWASSSSHYCQFTTTAFYLPSTLTFSLSQILSIWLQASALFITQHCLPTGLSSLLICCNREGLHLKIKPLAINLCSPGHSFPPLHQSSWSQTIEVHFVYIYILNKVSGI